MGLAIRLDHQHLSQVRRRAGKKAKRFALFADGEDREAPRPCPSGDVGGTRIVRPDDSRTAGRNDLIEQAHLGFEIAFHVAMIIEMVTAQIRERACLYRQTFGAILRKAVAGCFEGRMRSEEHTSELQSLMSISYAVFCWKKNTSTTK